MKAYKHNRVKTTFALMFTLGAMFITMFIAPLSSVYADAYGAFYIEPHLPENQYDQNVGYFDLMMTPNMEQTLTFDVVNQGDKPMLALLEFQNGTTSLNAEKSYLNVEKPDVSMKSPMTEMAQISDKELTIQPHDKKTVTVTVKAPQEAFDGVSVGGITVTADTIDNDTKRDDKQEFEIVSRTTYLLALQVRMNENTVDKNLNYIKSDTEMIQLVPKFISVIQNDRPVVMNDLTIDGTVTHENKSDIVAKIHKTTGGILPNTQFSIAYDLEGKKLEPGTYDIKLKITSGDDEWEWQEKHTVEAPQAKTLNENAQTPTENNTMIIILFSVVILLILIVLYLYYKMKKMKNQK